MRVSCGLVEEEMVSDQAGVVVPIPNPLFVKRAVSTPPFETPIWNWPVLLESKKPVLVFVVNE